MVLKLETWFGDTYLIPLELVMIGLVYLLGLVYTVVDGTLIITGRDTVAGLATSS